MHTWQDSLHCDPGTNCVGYISVRIPCTTSKMKIYKVLLMDLCLSPECNNWRINPWVAFSGAQIIRPVTRIILYFRSASYVGPIAVLGELAGLVLWKSETLARSLRNMRRLGLTTKDVSQPWELLRRFVRMMHLRAWSRHVCRSARCTAILQLPGFLIVDHNTIIITC